MVIATIRGADPMFSIRKVRAAVFLAVAVVGCGGAPAASPGVSSPAVPSVALAPATPSSVAVATPVPSGPTTLAICRDGQHCDVDAGSYVTGRDGFFEGLWITIPANWFLTEQDVGELALRPDDDQALILWKDVRVVTTTRAMGPANEIVKDVARTPDAFVTWFTDNDALTVIDPPVASSIGGTTGVVFSVQVSSAATYGDPGCPVNPRCADLVTDPAHWGPNFFAIGGDDSVRLYVATVPYPDGDHLFAIAWAAPSPAKLRAFVQLTQPIVDSIKVPDQYVAD